MRAKLLMSAATLMAAAVFSTGALAITAEATADLNIRSGPGPEYEVIGAIKDNDTADVRGCIEGSLWCQVNYKGKIGWAYSKYLEMDRDNRAVVISENRGALGIPTMTYDAPAGAAAGVATGAVAGALIGGPVGAAVGATVGAAAGGAAAAIDPPPRVHTYVRGHQVQPVYLDGEVVVGAGVPPSVALHPVPEYEYQYAYVNRVPVLVHPTSRRIVYVYR